MTSPHVGGLLVMWGSRVGGGRLGSSNLTASGLGLRFLDSQEL